MRIYRYLFFIVCLFLFSCALQMPPEGGPKDILPPKILSTDPENKSLNFSGKSIRIEFDEIISVNELSSQLVISPLLSKTPEIKGRKNTLYIEISDTLRENTTYTLNFGSGIADNNEGNKLEDYQFVFSTGSILDTLSISGKVIQAFDLATEKGILVTLYTDQGDSVPYLNRPVYFTKTNEAGEFRITNIAPGSYRIFAIDDKDGNYMYSSEEKIAFNNSIVQANDTGINLRLFTAQPSLIFLKSFSEFPGKASFVFNGPADSVKYNWVTDTTKLNLFAKSFSTDRDTLTFWYKNITADSLSITFEDKQIGDTSVIRLFKKTEGKPGRAVAKEFGISTGLNQTSVQHLHLPFYLYASRPVANADFSKIIFMEDSQVVSPVFKYKDSLHANIDMEYSWKEKRHYTLFIPPGTFTDIYNSTNDTASFDFYSHSETDYGSVTLKLDKTNDGPYIFQLLNKEGSKVIRQFVVKSDTTIEMRNLDPGTYRIKFIEDINGNGKWDTGNYLKSIQPETVQFFNESVLVRGNWDIELQMSVPFSGAVK